ncbi:MAG TPA: hypothetical protein VHY37_04640, partial [Tepidisphaeraceae bacterium]|nr:hypothetical protein [Tepidisphaeraceae bacterium]
MARIPHEDARIVYQRLDNLYRPFRSLMAALATGVAVAALGGCQPYKPMPLSAAAVNIALATPNESAL